MVVLKKTSGSIRVLLKPTPLLLYLSTAKPLSDRYSAICRKGLAGSPVSVACGGMYSFMSGVPPPGIRRTPGNGPSPTEGYVNWASVFNPSPRSITRSLREIVSVLEADAEVIDDRSMIDRRPAIRTL